MEKEKQRKNSSVHFFVLSVAVSLSFVKKKRCVLGLSTFGHVRFLCCRCWGRRVVLLLVLCLSSSAVSLFEPPLTEMSLSTSFSHLLQHHEKKMDHRKEVEKRVCVYLLGLPTLTALRLPFAPTSLSLFPIIICHSDEKKRREKCHVCSSLPSRSLTPLLSSSLPPQALEISFHSLSSVILCSPQQPRCRFPLPRPV